MIASDRRTRPLNRRDTLRLFGAASAATLIDLAGAGRVSRAAGFPPCLATPAETEGPFFVDESLKRFDLRRDPSDGSLRGGTPLFLRLAVHARNERRCAPLAGARVDLWSCDASGLYSDTEQLGTRGRKFLRGYQITNEAGVVDFLTLYPGWYQGRTVHLHFKVRPFSASGKAYEFTSQLYFDDAVSDAVFAAAPYNARGPRRVRNEDDGVFSGASEDGSVQRDSGKRLMLEVTKRADGGYAGRFDVGVDTSRSARLVQPRAVSLAVARSDDRRSQ